MSEQEQSRALAQEQAERVVQRLMRRYSADTHRPAPPSAQDHNFRDWLGLASGMPPAELNRASVEQADTRLIPIEVSRQRLCVALRAADGAIALVLADPFDRDHRLWLEARLRDAGHPRTRWYVTPVQALLGFVDRIEQTRLADATRHPDAQPPGGPLPATPDALRHLDAVLRQALAARATHLHWLPATAAVPPAFDPTAGPAGQWRMRVDGVLRAVALPPDAALPPFTTVFEALQSAATRDGLLPLLHAGLALHAPVSLAGTHRAAVLRLPPPAACDHPPSLDDLGHDEATLARLRTALERRHGVWLVAAPRGEGKTDTLQALARERTASGQRVVALTRPSSTLLDDALAQDPDLLVVDEPGTPEAMAVLLDEVLQGRAVVLGLAAPDPWSALVRLERLGWPAAVLAHAVRGVLAQHLLRLNCPSCSRPMAPARSGQPPSVRGLGCAACDHTGHMGRQVVSRWLALSPALAELLASRATPHAWQTAAAREGYTGLQDATRDWVSAGLVSLEEARRAVALAV
jgi:general secretion pathway protein E